MYYNMLMVGSPGSGKTMLARCMPGILPGINFEESIETTKLYSLAGLLKSGSPIVTGRPFRSPHHSASAVSLVGGGKFPRPGEVSLSHNGMLRDRPPPPTKLDAYTYSLLNKFLKEDAI